MPLTITKMTRLFQFHGIRLPDPNPNMPVDEVKALYAAQYPELATAVVNGPEAVAALVLRHPAADVAGVIHVGVPDASLDLGVQVDDLLVEVVAAEVRVAVGRLHFNHALTDLKDPELQKLSQERFDLDVAWNDWIEDHPLLPEIPLDLHNLTALEYREKSRVRLLPPTIPFHPPRSAALVPFSILNQPRSTSSAAVAYSQKNSMSSAITSRGRFIFAACSMRERSPPAQNASARTIRR